MTTVAYPTIQMHPWFRMPSLKRKAHSTDSDDASSPSDLADFDAYRDAALRKRRKCDVLENGIAQLSLDPSQLQSQQQQQQQLYQQQQQPWPFPPQSSVQLQPPAPPPSLPPSAYYAPTGWTTQNVPPSASLPPSVVPAWNALPAPAAAPLTFPNAYPVVFPDSVEEPTSPALNEEEAVDVPEVTMKGPSWYEPEKDRIVITDLDDDSDVEDDAGTTSGLSVNSALMSHIKAALANDAPPPELPLPDPSKALVLFRPLVRPESVSESPQSTSKQAQEQETRTFGPTYDIVDEPIVEDDLAVQSLSPADNEYDDDAMEIEYL